MVTGSTEWNGGLNSLQASQDHIKPQGVFCSKKASQQVLIWVVVVELSLNTFNIFR